MMTFTELARHIKFCGMLQTDGLYKFRSYNDYFPLLEAEPNSHGQWVCSTGHIWRSKNGDGYDYFLSLNSEPDE
jgi:hypothetical protein